jgi:outer membrane immunogenic protein
MKKLLLSLAFAASVFAPSATALAADLDVPPPPPVEELRPASYDWTGFYVGGWAGATCIEGILTEHQPGPPAVDVAWENSGCGWKGGVLGGYNHQFNQWVVGIEGDWGMSGSIAENEEIVGTGANFAFAMDHIATFRGRWGIAFDDTLLFATGGVAWAKGDVDGINGAANPNHIKGSHWGWTFGGGMEHAITDQFRVKLDYLFTRFNSDDYVEGCCDLTVEDFDDHEVRLGAIWAF